MQPKKTVKIQLVKNQVWIADQCLVAESFLDRLKGLIGRTGMEGGQGLLLRPCNDIHMWFMRIPIDVVFIRSGLKEDRLDTLIVTSVRENLMPWKLLPVRDGRASETLELPAGTVQRCNVDEGDVLELSYV